MHPLTVAFFIAIAAFISAVLAAMGKLPEWVAIIFLCIFALIMSIPLK